MEMHVDKPTDREAALTHWITTQRWFGGKGRPMTGIDVVPVGRLADDPPTRIEAVTVSYQDGPSETYHVPVSYRSEPEPVMAHALIGHWTPEGATGPQFAYDAVHDRAVTNAWLTGMASGKLDGTVSFQREPAATLPTDGQSIVLGGEQSNTSIVFDDAVILKVFRRLVDGVNPDVELLHALAQAGNDAVAGLLGWVEGGWTGADGREQRGTLAIATQFLPSATDGWDLALASIRGLLAETDDDPAASGGDFAGEAFRLGQATASVHADLARMLGTTEWSGPELARLVADLDARLEAAATAVPELQPFAREISARYAELGSLRHSLLAQRVHGDLHLGQVMRAPTGWRILDFEGEPARPITERAAVQSPLKDVAGMLRSFDYAAQQLLSGPEANRVGAAERAMAWAERNQRKYCAGYADVAGEDALSDRIPLTAFVLDKAVYEVVYETRNRPDWVQVPLGAIRRLLDAGAPVGGMS